MNLLADLIEGVQRTLTAEGVTFDAALGKTDPVHFLATYLEFDARRIETTPRTVRFSAELQGSPAWTTHQSALQRLAELCRTGQPLHPYQSKQIRTLEESDLLLADWNIQHLHLGEHVPGQAFADRTGPLLYATFLSDEAYFIAIMDHASFSEIGLLEVVNVNWPGYLERFTLKGVLGVSPVPSSDDVKQLRRAGVQTVIPLASGRVLAPPGGGYTTAGTSIAHVMKAQNIARLLRNAEQYVRQHDAEIRTELGLGPVDVIRLASLEPSHLVFMGDHSDRRYAVPIGG